MRVVWRVRTALLYCCRVPWWAHYGTHSGNVSKAVFRAVPAPGDTSHARSPRQCVRCIHGVAPNACCASKTDPEHSARGRSTVSVCVCVCVCVCVHAYSLPPPTPPNMKEWAQQSWPSCTNQSTLRLNSHRSCFDVGRVGQTRRRASRTDVPVGNGRTRSTSAV